MNVFDSKDISKKKSESRRRELFSRLEDEERVALYVSSVSSFPVDNHDIDWDDSSADMSWSKAAVVALKNEIAVGDGYFQAYRHLYPRSYSDESSNRDITTVFFDLLKSNDLAHIGTLMRLSVALILNGLYDARGRVLLRNIRTSLGLPTTDMISLEASLSRALHAIEDNITRLAKKDKSKYVRYAKIGAVSLGAGALLAVTGGLAAPAVAAAFLVFGSSAAVATAGLTSVTVMASLFGTAGVGLTGYKMARRTKGVEEFAFEQYGEKGKLAVVIMVSGWMLDKEDYKKTFGVVPDELTAEDRLKRFYEIHCPMRLCKAKEEARTWSDDLDVLYDNMTELYGLDPRRSTSLQSIHPYSPSSLNPSVEYELRDALASTLSAAEEEAKSPTQDRTHSSTGVPVDNIQGDKGWKLSKIFGGKSESANKPQSVQSNESLSASKKIDDALQSMRSGSLKSDRSMANEHDALVCCDEKIGGADTEGGVSHDADTHTEDDTENVLQSQHWDWNELPISAVYELNLLRWETDLQLELGKSIMGLLKSLRDMAVQKVLETTVLAALVSAVIIPYTILKLTDMIDNTWTLATERADQAGIELAHALLSRPQGSRSVTLVGHSMGARLIFSCLQELARCKSKSEEPIEDPPGTNERGVLASGLSSVMRSVRGKQEGESDTHNGPPGTSIPQDHHPHSCSSDHTILSDFKNEDDAVASVPNGPRNIFVSKVSSHDAEQWDNEAEMRATYAFADNIVQDVVMLGTPVGVDTEAWERARSVVSGRLINGYSANDNVLALIYRYEKWAVKVAGLRKINVQGVENMDFSALVKKHTDYCLYMKEILTAIDLTETMHADLYADLSSPDFDAIAESHEGIIDSKLEEES